jgi:hypothetical protein
VVGQLESSLHDNDDFIDDSDVKQKKKGKQKEETEKKLKVDGTQPSNAYEEFWQSDDDLDREELGDIVRGNVSELYFFFYILFFASLLPT